MATQKKRGKLNLPVAPERVERKTEALSIRIDPRVRYGLELLSRSQRRSVTGVVEWAIDQMLRSERVGIRGGGDSTFFHLLSDLWTPNEFERIANLALNVPELLTYEESRIWKVMRETVPLWGDSKRERFSSLDAEDWSKIWPAILFAAEKPIVKGLSDSEWDKLGVMAF